MPATRTQVREALAGSLDQIDGLRAHAFTPGQVNPPSAVVIELDVRYDATMARGSDDMTAVVRLFQGGDLRSSQIKLDEMAVACRQRLEADETLGDVVHYARMTRIRGDSEGEVALQDGSRFVVIDIEIEVVA